MPPSPQRPALSPVTIAVLQIAAMDVLLGLSWPVIKIGLQGATPVWLAFGRAAISCAASVALLLVLRRLKPPARADWPVVFSMGTFPNALFFALTTVGVTTVPAGRASILSYTVALWMVPLSLLLGEAVGWRRMGGVVVGVAGAFVLMDPWHLDWTDHDVLFGHACLLGAALSWGIALLHARRHAWVGTPLDVLPWQFGITTLWLGLLGFVFEPRGGVSWAVEPVAALIYLGIFAGPVGSWAITSAARVVSPVAISLGVLGAPVVGVAASTLWLGEPVTWPLLAGAALVGAGIVIVVQAGRRG